MKTLEKCGAKCGAKWLLSLGMMLTASASAFAASDSSPTASAILGYGFEDGQHWGLGGRGGVMVRDDIYVGGLFLYHFGNEVTPGVKPKTWFLQAEVGYDLPKMSSGNNIRPFVGIGIASIDAGVEVAGVSGTASTEFALTPGVAVIHEMNAKMFATGEARLNLIGGNSSVGAYVGLGWRLK